MQEQYRTAYILQEMGFEKQFDGIFSSAFIGYKKNQPEFYIHILNKLDIVNAEEVLFWDDTPKNVLTARSVGLQAELYTGFADFIEKMDQTLTNDDRYNMKKRQ
jgi:putative hydrolase of the HAD superfamily